MKGYAKLPQCTVERCWYETGEELVMYQNYHPYHSGPGRGAIHYHAREDGKLIAVFSFKPPGYGAAKKMSPDNPHAIIALSRMCAVPRNERKTQHISKLMRRVWPQLPEQYNTILTYSDSSCNHTGFVYKACGFTKHEPVSARIYHDERGCRVSINTSGHTNKNAIPVGYCALTPWTLRIPGR